MKAPLLSIRGLCKSYTQHLHGGRSLTVLRGAELELESGTCTVVRGPSGSGKSSLLRCVYRSALADSGEIRLRALGRELDLVAASEREIIDARRTLVAMATQFLRVVPRVSALSLVEACGLERAEACALLESLGLETELHELAPATFSGGQRQMLNLALTLARPRPLLLLDEATASLDPERRRVALASLLERKRAGTALLAIFHDLPELPGLVDRVVRLREGRLVAA
ncbi:MAG: ATP-binding cassette domain-containing protein [Vulcanimicrobiaceae bacterium]|jgi:alpha-D-ribose 1-methylphosphonate 5-triphosphate synthase subunit PhnL